MEGHTWSMYKQNIHVIFLQPSVQHSLDVVFFCAHCLIARIHSLDIFSEHCDNKDVMSFFFQNFRRTVKVISARARLSVLVFGNVRGLSSHTEGDW